MGKFDKFKDDWRKINKIEPERIPLYMKDWYWDAVCESDKEWQVVCNYSKDGQIEAAFPFKYTKRKGLFFIELPWQVACAGVWCRQDYSNMSKRKALLYLNTQVSEIIRKLPRYDKFEITFNNELWTWHPFYWLGFSAMPYYTSVIKKNNLIEGNVRRSISKHRRCEVSSGEKKYIVEIDNNTPEEYWEFVLKSYEVRGMAVAYDKKQFMKLIESAMDNNACKIQMVKNAKGNVIAGNVFLSDNNRVYNQFMSYLPGEDVCAQSLSIIKAVESALDEGKNFDFEGSMIQGVCEFYTSWNPEYEINYRITKTSKKYDKLNALRTLLRG